MPSPRSQLRKQPRQQRALTTVTRILDAGARVLIAYGYEGASTNRIASEAELSPGSLYQYFSDKDAIVAAIMERLASELGTTIASAFRSITALSVEDGARQVLHGLLDSLEPHANLIRAVTYHVPKFGETDALAELAQRGSDLVYLQLVANKDVLRSDDVDTTMWFVVQTTTHLTTRYVVDSPPMSRDTFVDTLAGLLVNFVYRPSSQNDLAAGENDR